MRKNAEAKHQKEDRLVMKQSYDEAIEQYKEALAKSGAQGATPAPGIDPLS